MLERENHVVSVLDNVVYDENGNGMVLVLDYVRNVVDGVRDVDVLYDRIIEMDVRVTRLVIKR